MKKLIICIDKNKSLTLCAIALGIAVGICGSATGWFAAIAGVITGAGILVLENLRRAYNHTWRSEHGKRWAMLSGMGVSASAVLAGVYSIWVNPTTSLGCFASIAAMLVTLATALTLSKVALDTYHPRHGKACLIVWAAFLGVIGLLVTASYALIRWMLGVNNITDLIHDDIVVWGGCVSAALIGVFTLVCVVLLTAYMWEKLVNWAKK